jgi:hypothetical protein
MPGKFDDILKNLTEWSSRDWVVRGGWTSAPTRVIDADIATISGAADKVICVTGSPDWLLSVDFQAGHDTVAKLADLLLYNSALYKRHKLRVRTLLVLLHPDADSPQVTGLYERGFPGEPSDVTLRYQTVRVWQVPAKKWLKGGLGLLPLAPLGAMRPEDLPAVIAKMKARLGPKVPRQKRKELWSATSILMGLCFELAEIESLLQGVVEMEQSVTYQAILNRGKAEEARKMLLIFGRTRFGEPAATELEALNAITEVGRIEKIAERLQDAANWRELLGPISSSRTPRRKSST